MLVLSLCQSSQADRWLHDQGGFQMILRWVSGGFQVVSRWSVEQKQQPEQVSHLQLFRGQEGELGLPAEQQWNCSFWRNEVLFTKCSYTFGGELNMPYIF